MHARHYILNGVMSCQNLCAYCQKLSHGSLSMLHGHCVSVSHLGLGCRGNHSSVNWRNLPSAQGTDGTTFQPAFHIAISFCFFRMTDDLKHTFPLLIIILNRIVSLGFNLTQTEGQIAQCKICSVVSDAIAQWATLFSPVC